MVFVYLLPVYTGLTYTSAIFLHLHSIKYAVYVKILSTSIADTLYYRIALLYGLL